MKYPRTIAVDFDCTLAKTKFPEIIEINEEVVDLVRKEKEAGSIIVIWTCRGGQDLKDAEEFLIKNNVPFDYINRDADWSIKEFAGGDFNKLIEETAATGRYIKVFAEEYWDDKAINVKDLLTRKFEIIELYESSDYNFSGEVCEVVLLENNKEIMSGDRYHEKIDHQIEGFFKALDYLGVNYEVEKLKTFHPHY